MSSGKESLFNEMANGLTEECMQEAAETLFGHRRDLEQEIGIFYDKVEGLRRILKQVITLHQGLYHLLLKGDQEIVLSFHRTIGIELVNMPVVQLSDRPVDIALPRFFISTGSRYTKAIQTAYERLAAKISDYLHGRHYPDPKNPKLKRVTENLDHIIKWHQELNAKIDRVNTDYAPSQTLEFAKRLNVEESARADKMACTLSHCNLDRDMAFPNIPWESLGLLAYPEMPKIGEVKDRLRNFSRKVFNSHGREVRALLDQVSRTNVEGFVQ